MREKYKKNFASLKSMKKEVGSGDPDPHKNVTDPQHWVAD
jgi:hypothetical protein